MTGFREHGIKTAKCETRKFSGFKYGKLPSNNIVMNTRKRTQDRIMSIDRSGNRYIEKDMCSGKIRATYVESGWSGEPSVRLQIRDESGHLRQGPEIPVANIGEAVGAMVELLAVKHS